MPGSYRPTFRLRRHRNMESFNGLKTLQRLSITDLESHSSYQRIGPTNDQENTIILLDVTDYTLAFKISISGAQSWLLLPWKFCFHHILACPVNMFSGPGFFSSITTLVHHHTYVSTTAPRSRHNLSDTPITYCTRDTTPPET